MVKWSPHILHICVGLQLNKIVFHPSFSINLIFMKFDLLSPFYFRYQFIQLGRQGGERCGATRNPELYVRWSSIEVHFCLNKKLRKMNFWDVFIKQQVTPLFIQLCIYSGSFKIVCAITSIQNCRQNTERLKFQTNNTT